MRDVPLAVLAGIGLAGVLSQNVGRVCFMVIMMFIASLVLELNIPKKGEQRRKRWRNR